MKQSMTFMHCAGQSICFQFFTIDITSMAAKRTHGIW